MLKINPNVSKAVLEDTLATLDGVIGAIRNSRPVAATAAQLEANRRNALKSTGPKTEAGKLASSRNAIKHGVFSTTNLMPEEDPATYDAFCDRYIDEFQPDGLEEENLVEEMIAAKWRLARLNGVEQGAWDKARNYLRGTPSRPKPEPTLLEIELETGRDSAYMQSLARVLQMQSRLHRDYHRAAKQLRQLQKERQTRQPEAADPDPLPTPQDSSTPSNSSKSSNSFFKTNPISPANEGILQPDSSPNPPLPPERASNPALEHASDLPGGAAAITEPPFPPC